MHALSDILVATRIHPHTFAIWHRRHSNLSRSAQAIRPSTAFTQYRFHPGVLLRQHSGCVFAVYDAVFVSPPSCGNNALFHTESLGSRRRKIGETLPRS